MFLTALELKTSHFSEERAFYAQALLFPLEDQTEESFTVRVGTTALTFRTSQDPSLL